MKTRTLILIILMIVAWTIGWFIAAFYTGVESCSGMAVAGLVLFSAATGIIHAILYDDQQMQEAREWHRLKSQEERDRIRRRY